jgi:putative membrane-bound dehydrogenase-like protein
LPNVRCLSTCLWLAFAAAAIAAPPAPEKSPVPAADSLRYFQLPDDLAIELVAAEPEVIDPIDIRFDEFGRMYVVEMRDYPLGPKPGEPPLSRIKLLEDRDGDGRFETAFVFAENLSFVTGVQPWKGGVIVTLAGRVAYLKDTDGDHKADLEETWFTGFAQENSQLRANHPRFAHDNHIYIANGLRGGKIMDVRKQVGPARQAGPGGGTDSDARSRPAGETYQPIDISGRDFRFDPRGTLAEAVSGVGQFGLCFDDFGHRFVCQNRNPVQHVVFEERDLKKSKHYTPPAVMNDVAAFAEKSKLFPLTKTWTTSNLHENTFTAACGVNIYRGNNLPEKYRGLALTCDPTGNLVHAEKMEPWGPTFRSKPLYEDREFLASTDEWFRPVAIENGPDGALYIVDMYRAVIEHPDWVPDELKRRPDERFGDDRGRIYRIVKKGERPAKFELPGKASPKELVQMLANENAWQRETSQRLLIERGEKDTGDDLDKLLNHEQLVTVFHALWTLHGVGLLDVRRLKNASAWIPGTKANLIDVADIGDVDLRSAILDENPFALDVATYIAFAPLSFSEAKDAARHIALQEQDPWSRAGVLLAIQSNAMDIWTALMADPKFLPHAEHHRVLSRELLSLAAAQAQLPRDEALHRMNDAWNYGKKRLVVDALLGFHAGLAKRGEAGVNPKLDAAIGDFRAKVFWMAFGDVEPSLEISRRLSGIETLQCLGTSQCRDALLVLTRDSDQPIRIAAVRAVLASSDDKTSSEFLTRVRSESPAVRRAILEGLVSRPPTLVLLLDAIEKNDLQTVDVDPTLVPRIVNVADPILKARAQKLFAPPPDADRQKTLETYAAALKAEVDPKAGRVAFEKNCATCHKIGDLGVNVAPDISDSRTKTPPQLLLDILQPNRAVDGNYIAYVVSTTDGRVLTGVISAETSQAITLKQPGGQLVVVPRSEIDELQSTGKSLMPDGLERTIGPQQMAEVISYIKNWRYLDGRVPASTVPR